MIRMSSSRQDPALRGRAPIGKLAAGLALALGLSATASPARAQKAPEVVVRLVGAYSLGSKAALEMATSWAKQLHLPGIRVEGGIDPRDYDVVAEGAESAQRLRVHVEMHGNDAGIEPLLRGQADIWMATRQISEADLDNQRKKKVPNVPTLAEFQAPGVENVVALAPIAILVNRQNPVNVLTPQQIRDIYTGKVTSWAQVGGPSNLPIGLYSLDAGVGLTGVFCQSVFGMTDSQKCVDSFARLTAPRTGNLDDVSDSVAGNPAGFAFNGYGNRRSAKPVSLGTECGTGIEPSLFRAKAEEYPLISRMYFYTQPGKTISPQVRDFLRLALGAAGQKAIANAGLGNLTPGRSDTDYGDTRLETARDAMDGRRTRVRAPDVKAFEGAISGADRLSLTFRFQAGTDNLDSRAEADLARLVDLMQQPEYGQSAITLIGFSGVAGDYTENRTLSRQRAESVKERLVAAGVKDVSAIGVGPAAAVACNLDPNTSPLNQRVEVWVHKK